MDDQSNLSPSTPDREGPDPFAGLSLTHRMLLGLDEPSSIQLPGMAAPATIVGEIPDRLKPHFGQ